MRILGILLILLMEFPICANASSISGQYLKPLMIKILSDNNGVAKEEHMKCTGQTCCFEENYYCAIEGGVCVCDLYMCNEGPTQKEYWMELSGFNARMYCEDPHLLHKLTGLCLCSPNKTPSCVSSS